MKPLIVAALVAQLVLIPKPPTIADGVRLVEIKEYPVLEPMEPLELAYEPLNVAPKSVSVQGSWIEQCHAWASQAGFTLPPAAISLIDKESKCNPNAKNPTSGACGIPQALPCSKLGTSDPVKQLIWMRDYVMARYGSWESALAFHHSHNWY